MLQNDIRRGGHSNGLTIPRTDLLGDEAASPTSPTSPWKSRPRAGSGGVSSSDYMQKSRTSFVSYGKFLAFYWDHLPQTFTRVLGEKQLFMHDLS